MHLQLYHIITLSPVPVEEKLLESNHPGACFPELVSKVVVKDLGVDRLLYLTVSQVLPCHSSISSLTAQ